ncbi:protein DpdF [Roseomonas indoligenes]|uniref:DNA 3'-5' helicase n=1 Tax=Roseomonas indoligenes TaxID=2820811 RepID=A0A940MXV4_9PROT|nr:protein DpdF [Pararoseomonas indoligenes]MBP0496278.1 ATP-dependent DNA helicase RecQ [Pararoseomonas indoligenes]
MNISGAQAFASLRGLLSGSQPVGPSPTLLHPAFERLRSALADRSASPLDRAVLLRHALLFETARRGGSPDAEVELTEDWDVDWNGSGLEVARDGGVLRVQARPWTPRWLRGSDRGVDAWAASEAERRFAVGSAVAGDPFLARLGLDTYRSHGQRAATRAVLTTPPGATLAVVLATGEGKSLLFRLVDGIGFAGQLLDGRRGVTLVVVPTVALALDQEAATGGDDPRAWVGGASERNAAIAEAVRAGTQGLCFASPEAACGPLRRPLLEAARAGVLRALVIDEAHLVDAWGTGFRTEFQTLAGLQHELLAASPPTFEPRTICLSATLGDAARETLETLFGARGFRVLSAARLRPEPDYWIADPTDQAGRATRVLEALRHVPRPAVLYVTRVRDAEEWRWRLAAAGFGRARMVHGGTSAAERESVLDAWRRGTLDLVVATSAFGLGIDYPHVRSVLHACVPETLDRYYQEVGRGGRDGRSCLSLVVPAYGDAEIAMEINDTVVIGLPRGRERWAAMFNGPKRHLGGDRFALRIDVAPGEGAGDIDMVGERSTDWNARTLTLLARAGVLRLLGGAEQVVQDAVQGSWQSVEILDHDHLAAATWDRRVGPVRRRIAVANARSLGLMHNLLAQAASCPADLLRELYRDATTVCSRCEACRYDPECARRGAPDAEPVSPWPCQASVQEPVRSLLDHGNRLVVKLDEGMLARRRLPDVLARLTVFGLRNLVVFGEADPDFDRAIDSLRDLVVFVARDAIPGASALPPGPEIVLVGAGAPLRPAHLAARVTGQERILFVRPDARSPSRPQLPLDACHDGRVMPLREVQGRLLA